MLTLQRQLTILGMDVNNGKFCVAFEQPFLFTLKWMFKIFI